MLLSDLSYRPREHSSGTQGEPCDLRASSVFRYFLADFSSGDLSYEVQEPSGISEKHNGVWVFSLVERKSTRSSL